MAIDTAEKRWSVIQMGDDAPMPQYAGAGRTIPDEDKRVFLGLFSATALEEWLATGDASIIEPLALAQTIIKRCKTWQRWAGSDHGDRILFNANRTRLEIDDQMAQSYISDRLDTPFIIIWVNDLVLRPVRCVNTYNVIFFVQDSARYKNDHNASADYFGTRCGQLVDDLAHEFTATQFETLDCKQIQMIAPPQRVGVKMKGQVKADMWTSTFHLVIGPDVS